MINHQNGFSTAVSSATTAGNTTSPLLTLPVIDPPFYLAFDATSINGNYEVVLVSSKTATNVNHAALLHDHNSEEEVRMIVPAEEMDALSTLITPGIVQMYAAATAPQGWLLCQGQEVSRTDYAALFAAISTTYGVGDGTTTFLVPNLQGRVPVGVSTTDNAFDRGDTGGEKTNTLTVAQMPVHNHGAAGGTGQAVYHGAGTGTQLASASGILAGGNFQSNKYHSNAGSSGANSYATLDINTNHAHANNGSSSAHNNLQPFLALNFIIKT